MSSPHGTLSRYTNSRCRCDECKKAHTAHHREWYQHRGFRAQQEANRRSTERLRERVASGDPTVNHGTTYVYRNGGCRCEPCRGAASEAWRRWRDRQTGRS